MTSIRDIGEQGLLKIVQSFCPPSIIGDDAALVALTPGCSLVVTTDVLVDNTHFSDRTTSPEDVGWRAACANLSDLAAMGAEPLGITVGLSLPSDLSVEWVERLYRGMSACLKPYDTPIVGGDIVSSPVITVSITALGQVLPQRAIKRNAARPGDVIISTGYHGLSRAGLELLLHSETGKDLKQEVRDMFIRAHQRPTPRLDLLPYLRRLPEPIGGMDSSDGLADAILQICRGSRTGAVINRINIHEELIRYASPITAMEWALYGGEDFQLILTMPLEQAQKLLPRCGEGSSILGAITADEGEVKYKRGEYELTLEKGFQHF